jgi:hypothetical protein
MTGRVAGQRRGRFVRAVVLVLFLGAAAGGVLFGPALTTDLAQGSRTFEKTKRKFEQLRSFALFRSRGDRAVLRWGEPPSKTRTKKSLPSPGI